MKPRKPIPKVSKRRSQGAKVYSVRKKLFLASHEQCFCCGIWIYPEDRELHHVRGRAGKLYLDERFWEMACGGMRGCHAKIHRDRKWAIANGFLGGAGEWGCSP